jgi:hypothetical protein
MTLNEIKALSDSELDGVIAWAQDEKRSRAEKHKQETLARIRELAGSVGVTVTINGTRGRPPKAPEVKAKRPH